jgi:hypothetical protein
MTVFEQIIGTLVRSLGNQNLKQIVYMNAKEEITGKSNIPITVVVIPPMD